jgi:hypothetical protein
MHAVDLAKRCNVTAANPVPSIEAKHMHGFLLGLAELRLQQTGHIRC